MPSEPPTPDRGRPEFYSDPAAVGEYISYRDRGASRNQLLEEPSFLALIGDVDGKQVLDLGCGYGHYSELLARKGAKVLGIDRAELMIAEAKKRSGDLIDYRVADIETVELPAESFDVVVSNLAFHYLSDLRRLFDRIFAWLRPGGQLVFTVEHPIYTAGIEQEHWCDTEEHRRWVVSDYFAEGARWGWFGLKYHHTVEGWLDTVLQSGFQLRRLLEPRPSPAALEALTELAEDQQRPLFLVVSCAKP
jgi:SAM-dependent methyltransferase